MKFKTSLRYRVSMAFALLGAMVSLVIAGAFYVLTIDMEERLIAETLDAELKDYMARYVLDPATPPPVSTSLQTYIIKPDDPTAPKALQNLEPGLHQVYINGGNYYAEVREEGKLTFVILFTDAQIRQRERQYQIFFIFGVLVMTVLSALLGYWLAGRVISPVGELARRVADLRPEDQPPPLAMDFPPDEVGELAQDFDAYLKRLSDFIVRERAFTSDVSHELRTPLAVIKGAADVLLADASLDEKRRRRVERIARSVQEMSELTTALLMLAREKDGVNVSGSCDVGEILEQLLETHNNLLQHKPVEVKLSINARVQQPVECMLLRVVLANLIRNAFSYIESGRVDISLDEQGVVVKDTGIGIPAKNLQRVFDRDYSGQPGGEGIGLSLVKRICARYGWRIHIQSEEGQGTRIQLLFAKEG